MVVSEFKHLSKEQLRRRVKVLHVPVYLAATIAIASYVTFFATHDEHHWSWLLISATYTLFPFNFVMQIRRMRKG